MKVICGGRGSGKTIKAIKLSAETQNYIVCRDKNECSRIAKIAHEMNLNIPFPVTFNDFIVGSYYGRNIKGFIIDNVDMLLNRIAHGSAVTCVTLNLESEVSP